jgi:programmed cell death protein 5
MDNLAPSNVSANELPSGFTTADPNDPSASSRGGSEADFKKQAIQEQKQMILEQAMDSDALARLGRIKLVKPEKAESVENTIVSMAMQGKLPGRISEAKLIEIMERGQMKGSSSQAANNINIQRKQYAFDSDDDGDDDDDV